MSACSILLFLLKVHFMYCRHRGCRCPREFYGDHCEYLKFDGEEAEDTTLAQQVPFNPNAIRSPATAIMMTLMTLSLVMVGALIRRKLTAQRVPREITFEQQQQEQQQREENIEAASPWSNRYSDSRFNGRHRSYNSQNLHIQTVFEDAEMA